MAVVVVLQNQQQQQTIWILPYKDSNRRTDCISWVWIELEFSLTGVCFCFSRLETNKKKDDYFFCHDEKEMRRVSQDLTCQGGWHGVKVFFLSLSLYPLSLTISLATYSLNRFCHKQWSGYDNLRNWRWTLTRQPRFAESTFFFKKQHICDDTTRRRNPNFRVSINSSRTPFLCSS